MREITAVLRTYRHQSDVTLLLAHVLNKPLTYIFAHPEHILSREQWKSIASLIQRRDDGEPLAYITGTKEFYGRDFFVNRNTLIPRPETELLIDCIIDDVSNATPAKQKTLIIDVGTGSGNIITTLAKKRSKNTTTTFCATDISAKALYIARKNAAIHHCKEKISFHHANLLDNKNIHSKIGQHDHIIIAANLPYVDTAVKKDLLHTIESRGLRYEPSAALWSAHSGLAHYHKLLVQTATIMQRYPAKKISHFYEIDPAQKNMLKKMIRQYFPHAQIVFHKDLSERWRICAWYQDNVDVEK